MNLSEMKYFTLEEVSEKLRIGVQPLRRLIKTKKIIANKFGKSYQISEVDLENFLKNTRTDNK